MNDMNIPFPNILDDKDVTRKSGARMISTNSLQKRMPSWWIEGKVSAEFQYLSQASWSQKNAACNF